MLLKDGDLFAAYTNMGGFMQPQGHVQLLLNMVLFGMDAQSAIDAPRFCIGSAEVPEGIVSLEEGVSPEVVESLRKKGHNVVVRSGYERTVFGRATIIRRVN